MREKILLSLFTGSGTVSLNRNGEGDLDWDEKGDRDSKCLSEAVQRGVGKAIINRIFYLTPKAAFAHPGILSSSDDIRTGVLHLSRYF